MPPVDNVSLSPYSADFAEIERKRALAQALQAQSMQPIETSAVNGIPVPISPFQGLAKLLQGYNAGAMQRNARNDQAALYERQQGDRSTDFTNLAKALQGTPATPERFGGSQGGPDADLSGMDSTYTPATAGTPAGRIDPAMLGALKTPEVQSTGMSLWAQQLARDNAAPTKVDLGDRIGLMNGQGVIVGYLPKSATPDAQLRSTTTLQTHATPSGSAILQEEGSNARHLTPSGSAVLGSDTTRRGQDMTDARTRAEGAANRGVTIRGQNISIDPTIQGQLANVRAAGKEFGEAGAQAQINLPTATAKGQQALDLVDQMIGGLTLDKNGNLTLPKGGAKPHAGFSVGVGASAQPGFQYIPGTDKASFAALLDQVKGGAFLQAFESLKGGGQITEVEGKKATDAITRMNTSQSEAEFVKGAREFQAVIRAGMERAKQKASPGRRASDQPGAVIDFNSLPQSR